MAWFRNPFKRTPKQVTGGDSAKLEKGTPAKESELTRGDTGGRVVTERESQVINRGGGGGGNSTPTIVIPDKQVTPAENIKVVEQESQPSKITPPKTETASTSLTQVKSFIKKEKAEDVLSSYKTGEEVKSKLNIGESKKQNPLITSYIKQQKDIASVSISRPSYQTIKDLKTEGKITPEEYGYGASKVVISQYKDIYADEFKSSGMSYKDWVQTDYGKKTLGQTSVMLGRIGFMQEAYDFRESLPKRVAIGGAVGGASALAGLGISTLSQPVGWVVGAVGLGVVGTVATYKGITATMYGVEQYKKFKKYGAEDAVLFGIGSGTQRFVPTAVDIGSGIVGAGVVAGGYNFLRTGKVTGYSKSDIKSYKQIIQKENIWKFDVKDAKTSFIKTSSGGRSVVQTSRVIGKIDTTKLTPSELRIVKWFNPRITSTQRYTLSGGKVTGIDAGTIRTGGLIGQKNTFFGRFQGSLLNNKIVGGKITVIGSGNKPTEIVTSLISSKGKIQFSKNNLFFGETSRTMSITTGRYKTVGGKLVNIMEGQSYGSGYGFGKYKMEGVELLRTGKKTGSIKYSFRSVAGENYFGGFKRGGVIDFGVGGKATNIYSEGSLGGKGVVTRQVLNTKFVSPTPDFSVASSQLIQQPRSLFFGTGTYEQTATQSSRMTQIPKVFSVQVPTTRTDSKTKTATATLSITSLGSGQRNISVPKQITTPITTTKPIQDTKMRISPITTTKPISPTRISPPTITTTTPPFNPTLFNLPKKFPVSIGLFYGDIKSKRKYQYFPSFKAIVFNIRGKGKKPTDTQRFTGLETRPIYRDSFLRNSQSLFKLNRIKF